MNFLYPVYTKKNQCYDCYKCIRHCPAKAIKLENGSASVIPELCVSCGTCVKVCPAGAKQIRNDVDSVKFLLSRGEKIIVSIAPSWRSVFKNANESKIIYALKKLGFYGVSETALGAQIVSSELGKIINKGDFGIYISSACPSSVEYIKKYIPEHTKNITKVFSPVGAHSKFLKKFYKDDDIKVVFFGPCAAKKLEADNENIDLDVALTFQDLDNWFKEEKIFLDEIHLENDNFYFIPENAEEGNIYAFEGGMIETLRDKNNNKNDICYITISGLFNIDRILSNDMPNNLDVKLFIECLACEGGCINGPGTIGKSYKLSDILEIAKPKYIKNSLDRKNITDIFKDYKNSTDEKSNNLIKLNFTDEEIKNTLKLIGKNSEEDELNCGGCGYQTCKKFAKAILSGKAEKNMCLSYLKKLAQNKSNALIKYIPAAVVIVNKNLKIVECNKKFSNIFGDEETKLAFEACPGLENADLTKIVPFVDLFEDALKSGKDILKNNLVVGDKIFSVNIFTVEPFIEVGAIIRDITNIEFQREQIALKAKKVIDQNIFTVQKIANYLGEHMAETEILLREVAEGFDFKHEKKK
jgi:iron only hydrogenase large subunit-like protein